MSDNLCIADFSQNKEEDFARQNPFRSCFTCPDLHGPMPWRPPSSPQATLSNPSLAKDFRELDVDQQHDGDIAFCYDPQKYSTKQVQNRTSSSRSDLPTPHQTSREIWVINQPKCGTGSLVDTVIEPENCNEEGINEQILLYRCPKHLKVFRTHHVAIASEYREKEQALHKQKRSNCLVVSAVRDPRISIPSLFFEYNKERFCDGRQSGAEILTEYDYWLRNSIEPTLQMRTTSEVSEAFGLQDFGAVLERMKHSGFAVFEESSNLDSPWNGCKLLLVQLDFEENNENISKGFSALLGESVVAAQGPTRAELCPHARKNYKLVKGYVIEEDIVVKLAKDSPELRHGFNYYRKARVSGDHIAMATTPPKIAEGQPPNDTLATSPAQESQSIRWTDPRTIEKKG